MVIFQVFKLPHHGLNVVHVFLHQTISTLHVTAIYDLRIKIRLFDIHQVMKLVGGAKVSSRFL